ncbi:hypothetical protein TWF970_006767 [Orbilia oligospora]|uniref:Uncharacterized protein n=1 Tax=Orbilia oligospora TaxID=2813651 RepID=A0A7C8R7P3_ORBOL|nr:hypothetical protein TWF970_006767 [Orbilia oligospora]
MTFTNPTTSTSTVALGKTCSTQEPVNYGTRGIRGIPNKCTQRPDGTLCNGTIMNGVCQTCHHEYN